MPEGGQHAPEARRWRRLEQLRRMTDDDFVAEVRLHQATRWQRGRLLEHAKRHRRDLEVLVGRPLGPSELEELSRSVVRSWERLFTSLEPDDEVSYAFASRWSERGGILVVVTRAGRVRTMMPMASLDPWRLRKRVFVEVTDRARRLGL